MLSHVRLFCDPVYCSPPGFSVHGISQARILEWVAISFSRGSSQPRARTCISTYPALAGGFFTVRKPPICIRQLYFSYFSIDFTGLVKRLVGMKHERHQLQPPFMECLELHSCNGDEGFPGGSAGKESACNAGDIGSIPEWGRSPGEGNGNPL